VNEPKWLSIARDLIGLREIKGSAHEPKILALWKDAGLPFNDDETAWCAGFVGGCLARAGCAPSLSAAARSYSSWGIDVLANGHEQIPLGAVVVYSRPPSEWSGHVGFAVGRTPEGAIMTLGGNQKDSVNIAPFDPDRLIAARWPVEQLQSIGMLASIPVMTTSIPLSAREA
jgi:uncharacterized protein (TIGR02594 family)